MLRELNVLEQRYRAVVEVLSGTPVIEVAERYGVVRQTVHRWVARYRAEGLDCGRSRNSPGAVIR
jgi:transposase